MKSRTSTPWLLAATFVGVGALHFLQPKNFDRIVPPWVEDKLGMTPRQATLVSGAAEVAGGLALLLPATRPVARVGLLALLAAVFPANVYMAQQTHRFPIPRSALWLRLPLQPVLAWAVWQAGR